MSRSFKDILSKYNTEKENSFKDILSKYNTQEENSFEDILNKYNTEKQKPLTEGSLPENIVEQESQRQLTVLQQDAQKEAAKIKTEKRMEEQKTRTEAQKRIDIAFGKKGLEENLQKMKDLVSTEAAIQNYEEFPDSYKKLVSEKQFNEWKDQGEMTGRQKIGQEKYSVVPRLPFSPLRAAEKISLNNASKRLKLGEQGYIDWAKKQTEYRYEYMEGGKYRKIKQNLSKKRIKKAAEDQHKRDKERRDEYLIKLAEQQVRGTTMAGNVGLGISEVPAYMIEFIALTPLTSATVSKKAYGALKILKPIVKNYKLRRIAAKSVAVVYGGALRAFLQPHRVAEGTYTQQVESNLGIIDDRSLFESLGESFTNNWIENTTELLGAGGGALGKMSSKRAQEFFKAIGMGGFLGEYGEEVAGDFLRAVFNVGEFRNDEGNIVDRLIKAAEKNVDLENILTTSGVLGATQVGMQVGTQGASIPTRIRNKRIEKQIKKIEKRLSSLIEIEQKPKTEIEIKKKPKIEEKAETEDTPQEVKVKKLKALNNAIAQDEKIKQEDKKETKDEKDKTTTQRTGTEEKDTDLQKPTESKEEKEQEVEKQPYEMTKEEFAKAYMDKGDDLTDLGQRGIIDKYKKKIVKSSEVIELTEKYPKEIDYDRFVIVRKALSENKEIPPEVLADYPDLQEATDAKPKTGTKVGTKIGTKLEGQKPKIKIEDKKETKDEKAIIEEDETSQTRETQEDEASQTQTREIIEEDEASQTQETKEEVEPTAEQIKQAEQPKQKITSTYETKTIPVEQTDNVVKGVANLLSDTNPTSEQKVALIEEFEDELGDYTDEMTSIIESDESNTKLIPLFNKNKADIKSRLQKSTNKDTQKLIKDVQPIQEEPKIKKKPSKKTFITEKAEIDKLKKEKGKTGITGKTQKVITNEGKEHEVRFEILDINDIIDSNQKEHQKYPILQPRDRGRVGMQAQIDRISAQLDPQQLEGSRKIQDGSPLIGISNYNFVEGGNGGTQAIKKAYGFGDAVKNPSVDKYKKYIINNAEKYGIDKNKVKDIKQPILVRRRVHKMTNKQLADYVDDTNQSSTAEFSAIEKSISDAGKLTDDMLTLLNPKEDGTLLGVGNQTFRDQFIDKIIKGQTNVYIDSQNKPTSQFGERMRNAIFTKTYHKKGNKYTGKVLKNLIESPNDNTKRLVNALVKLSPKIAEIKALINKKEQPDLDISNELGEAVGRIAEARANGISIENMANQTSLTDPISDIVRKIILGVEQYKNSGKKIHQLLDNYYTALKNLPSLKQESMFGAVTHTKAELFDEALKGDPSLFRRAVRSKDIKVEKRKLQKRLYDITGIRGNLQIVPEIVGNERALGKYYKGLIQIVEKGDMPKTLNHEMFHLVEDMFLTKAQLQAIKKLQPNAEKRAEGFANYVADHSSVTGRIKRFFSKLWRKFKKFMTGGKEIMSIVEVYDEIMDKKYNSEIEKNRYDVKLRYRDPLKLDEVNRRIEKTMKLQKAGEELRKKQEEAPLGIDTLFPNESALEVVIRKIQNYMHPARKVVKLAKEIRFVDDALDFYEIEELSNSIAVQKIQELQNKSNVNKKGSFMNRLINEDFSVQQLDEFLYAQFAEQVNKQIYKKTKGKNAIGSGMPTHIAKKLLKKYNGTGLEKFTKEFRDLVIKPQLEMLYENDFITEKTYKRLKQDGDLYIPLMGHINPKNQVGSNKKYSKITRGVRNRWGRTTLAGSPVMNGLLNFEKTVVITENNKVFQSLLKFTKEFPNFKLESGLPLFEVESQKYIPSYNKYGQLQTMRPIINANDYQLAGWVDNGKQVIISINDESVARAIKGFGVKKTIPIFNSINRYLKTMYTAASIPFLFTNFQKDMGTALVNISQQEQKGLRREMVKNVFPAIKGAIAGSRGATTGKWVRIYLDYAQHGAKASWVKNYSLEEKVKDFEKKIKRYKKSNDVVKIIETTVNFVEDLNSAVENGIRIAAYEGLVRRGVSKQKAAIAAKNLTVNFQKKGEWGPVMDSLFLFAGAGIQGTAVLLEASKNKKVRKIIAGLIVGQTLMALMNGMFGGDDYDKIPNHIKDTNFIFMLPNGKHLRIKYPFGYSFFLVLGNTLADGMRGKAGIGESIKRIFTGFSSAFNPIGSISSFKQFITPTIFDPIVQIAGNKTFYGGQIHPEQIPWNAVPKSQLYFDGVSDGTKALTLWINRVSGGARGVSGDVDISPEVLDHLLNFAVGSAGRFVTQTLEMGVSLFKDGELPPTKKIPIVNLFYGERSMYIDVQTVYKMLKEGTHKVYSKREKRNFIKALEDATNEGRFTNKQFQDIRDRFIDQQRDNKLLLERGTSKEMWKALDILSEHEIRSEEETKEFLRLLGIAADKGNFTNEEYQKFRNKYFNQQKKLTKIKKIEENK